MLRLPLSLVLTCLAVLALLTNPVAAAAAQAACAQSASAPTAGDDMPGMTMTPMAGADRAQAQKTAHPCCDQAANHKSAKDCAQTCAISCAVVVLPATMLTASLAATPVANIPHPDSFGYGHDPLGLHRPPKFIA